MEKSTALICKLRCGRTVEDTRTHDKDKDEEISKEQATIVDFHPQGIYTEDEKAEEGRIDEHEEYCETSQQPFDEHLRGDLLTYQSWA
ncbi:hypothetical protein Sjap_024815 [Stephania japonica]|uniref:Uncharacterized protein n=1 Tax=Stephania japonica TaxID=461633 RepID=A0AAP0EJG1_9MAGN